VVRFAASRLVLGSSTGSRTAIETYKYKVTSQEATARETHAESITAVPVVKISLDDPTQSV
jgi:hypothetical protein